MDELTPKQKGCQAIAKLLESLKAQFQEGMTKAEFEAKPDELPAELLVAMLRLGDAIERVHGRARCYLPTELKPKKEKHVKSWDERAREILTSR